MKTEFEVILRGRTEASSASLEQVGNIWVFNSDGISCVAIDPKTAITGALGLYVGMEIWNSRFVNQKGDE